MGGFSRWRAFCLLLILPFRGSVLELHVDSSFSGACRRATCHVALVLCVSRIELLVDVVSSSPLVELVVDVVTRFAYF